MKVWIVQGSTGEYSDHCEWLVGGYLKEAKAQKCVLEAQARANELIQAAGHRYYTIPQGSNEFDPEMKVDYTGVHYTCFPVEVDDEQ